MIQKFVEWEMRTGTPTWKLTQASKQYEINRKANHQKTYIKATENNKILNEILKAYKERYDRHFRKCRGELRVYKLISRLTIGLGGADIREIGFTLHRHGFPYVPSSALKGAARASAELIEKASQEDIQEVFGWTPDPKQGLEDACIGRAFFWDAIPLPGQRLLELDVMNPHFPTYYRTEGRKPPAEWD
ncbi:MAG: type III-B CRISPR module RAMP protein Cmr6, partial [Bacteroidia bacterium]